VKSAWRFPPDMARSIDRVAGVLYQRRGANDPSTSARLSGDKMQCSEHF
jgi:hypothetical protein